MPEYFYEEHEYDDESEFSSSPSSSSSSFVQGGDSAVGLWADHPANCMCVACGSIREQQLQDARAFEAMGSVTAAEVMIGILAAGETRHQRGCSCRMCVVSRAKWRRVASERIVPQPPKPPPPPSGRRIRTKMRRDEA